MIIGSIGCGTCMLIMAITAGVANFTIHGLHDTHEEEKDSQVSTSVVIGHPSPASIVFFTFFYIFLAFYGSTWGPLGWVRCLLSITLDPQKKKIQDVTVTTCIFVSSLNICIYTYY